MFRGLITAIRTLTILPAPGKDAEKLAASLPWFPVVGLLLGLLLRIIPFITEYTAWEPWPEGLALGILFLSIALTRGLHLDGVADWADGFWGSMDREKVLVIMKDSAIGAFGTVALVFVLLAKWVCFARLIDTSDTHWIVAAYILSRSMQAILAISFPYARAEGGTGESFIRDANPRYKPLVILLALCFMVIFCGFDWIWFPLLAVGWLVTHLLGKWSTHRIGGITGDTLGAFSEIIELFVLAAGAFINY